MEFKIDVSSESSRTIDPNNSPSNFKTIFDKPITLDQNKTYLIGLDKIDTMTSSWYNINEEYKNNKIRFGTLSSNKDTFDITYYNIEFSSGSYTYDNINEYIQDTLILYGKDKDAFKLVFDYAKFKCKLVVKSGFVLDLSKSTFCNLIGFEDKVYGYINKLENSTYWGTKTPNITNSVDTIYIHCDLISNSIVDGKYSDVIYKFSTANLERSFPFSMQPQRVRFNEINKSIINSITIYITDVYGRIINLNGVDVSFSFIIKEQDKLR